MSIPLDRYGSPRPFVIVDLDASRSTESGTGDRSS
jgi:hypothetical protein